MPPIEVNSIIVDSMCHDTTRTHDVGGGATTPQRIRQQRRADALALIRRINCEAADQQEGNPLRHGSSQFRVRERDPLLDRGRNRVIPNYAGVLFGGAGLTAGSRHILCKIVKCPSAGDARHAR